MSTGEVADVIAPVNEEGTQATILRWCKAPGDSVRKDEPLLELETDKVTVEISSPATGELCEILKQPDEEVLPGQVLGRVRIAHTAPSDPAQDAPNDPAHRAPNGPAQGAPNDWAPRLLSPAVRRLLAEHALSAEELAGSGHHGRITAQDIERHVAERGARRPPERGRAQRAASTRVVHTPMRRRVAEHMVRSVSLAPHVTTLFEADLTRVQAHRARYASEFERQHVRLTLTAYFIAACARALSAHPAVNATFHDDAIELHTDAHIGIGTALGDAGLIVPVLHHAQTLDLFGTARRLGELVAAARAGRLKPQDVRGGTFTISNHGVGGSLLAAPIVINQPQVAILGIGKVERRVCAIEAQGAEAIGVRSMCYLTLTIDHRALDAFHANGFLASVVNALEQWPQDPRSAA